MYSIRYVSPMNRASSPCSPINSQNLRQHRMPATTQNQCLLYT